MAKNQDYLIFLKTFKRLERVLKLFGFWAIEKKHSIGSLLFVFNNMLFISLACYKNIVYPGNEAASDAFTHCNGTTLVLFYLIWLIFCKKNSFTILMKQINDDLSRQNYSSIEKSTTLKCGNDLYKYIKMGTSVIIISIIGKIGEPILQLIILKLSKKNLSEFSLPESMVTPNFIIQPIRFIIEICFRSFIIVQLFCCLLIFIVICLYLESQLNGLRDTLISNHSPFTDDYDVHYLNRCAERHIYLLEITKQARILFGPFIFLDCFLSTINVCFVLFAIALNVDIHNIIQELTFLLSGLLQLLIVNWFSERILEANSEISNAAYFNNWTDESLIVQKKLIFIIKRAQLKEAIDFFGFRPSLERFLNILTSSYGYFNILYKVYKEKH